MTFEEVYEESVKPWAAAPAESFNLSRESFIGDDKEPGCEGCSICFFLIRGNVGDFMGQFD